MRLNPSRKLYTGKTMMKGAASMKFINSIEIQRGIMKTPLLETTLTE
jgi:hypothetical protein